MAWTHSSDAHLNRAVHQLPRSDLRVAQMVGRSFRCGIHARREESDIAWSFAWQEMAGVLGAQAADRLSKSLGGFVASVEAAAARKIEVLPKGCPGLCRDECLAVSIIAASQRGVCPALRACIFALIENGEIEPCVRSAAEFSHALSETGYTLPADVVCNALALMPDGAGRTHPNA
jgi:hypothetical protein